MANSPLGIKRNITFSLNLSKAKRGVSIKRNTSSNINSKVKNITVETRQKMSERAKGVSVKVFDNKKNLIYHFPTMTTAAKHFGVDSSTISNIFKTGISYDDYKYEFAIKDIRV
jgi:hypothetical protein